MAEIHGYDIVRNGLVLHLDAANPQSFDGNSTTWNDLSGNGNKGTLTNGPTYNSSNRGAIVFDGVNDYVNCGNPSNCNFNNSNFTICVAVKIFNFDTTVRGFFSKGTRTGGSYHGITLTCFSWLGINYIQGNLGINNLQIDASVLNPTIGWNYVCYNRNNTDVNMYCNGILTENHKGVAIGSTDMSAYNIQIGTSSTQFENVYVSMVQIYNRALSQSEITQNFNATRNRYGI